MVQAGFDSVPTNTFSFYDQMLDTAAMLGALPPRVAALDDPLDQYFAAARGAEGIRPLELTKWFDTNYHYLVPEIAEDTFTSPSTVKSHLSDILTRLDLTSRRDLILLVERAGGIPTV